MQMTFFADASDIVASHVFFEYSLLPNSQDAGTQANEVTGTSDDVACHVFFEYSPLPKMHEVTGR